MKILIVSKFFYPRGGAEVVAISTKRLLESQGHEVRIFSMDHPQNLDIADRRGYASEINFDGGIKEKIRGAGRVLGKGDVAKAADKVIAEFKPDVVHLHNVHSYLSPVAGEIAHKKGIRVVWTIHDYKLICPAYSFRRPDGTLCQECLGHGKGGVISHRCMKGGLPGSVLAYLEAIEWNRTRIERFTDAYLTPSRFMGDMMKREGFNPEKVFTLCNFIDPSKMQLIQQIDIRPKGRGFFCYIGRLSEEKGVETMIEAAARAGVPFKVAGRGPLLEPLKSTYKTNKNIEFLGHLDPIGLADLLSGAEASVMPSECFENNPLGVIESLCAGVPVIGADIGGIPELITSENGRLFPSRDVEALTKLLKSMSRAAEFDRQAIAEKAQREFSEDTHYEKLMRIYRGQKI